MDRCGVEPARRLFHLPGRPTRARGRFLGLQGYQGHLQMLTDLEEKHTVSGGTGKLIATRRLIEGRRAGRGGHRWRHRHLGLDALSTA
jgi:hypothetical protein